MLAVVAASQYAGVTCAVAEMSLNEEFGWGRNEPNRVGSAPAASY